MVCEHCGGSGWCPWPVSQMYDVCPYDCAGGVCRRCGGTGRVEEVRAVVVTERGAFALPHPPCDERDTFRLPPGWNPFKKRWQL